jgi:tetratricopeptide (TPR) repeat protein
MKTKKTNPNKLIIIGKYSEAKRILKRKLRYYPEDHWLLTELSTVFYQEKKYTEALKIIKKAYILAPRCPLVNWHYADTLNMLGRKREALIIWQKIVKSGVNSIAYDECGEGLPWARSLWNDSIYGIGSCYYSLGKKKLAVKYIKLHIKNRALKYSSVYSLIMVKKKLKTIIESE